MFLCLFTQYEIIWPRNYAFSESHTVKKDIPGVWLISRNDVISEKINLVKASSEGIRELSLQGR